MSKKKGKIPNSTRKAAKRQQRLEERQRQIASKRNRTIAIVAALALGAATFIFWPRAEVPPAAEVSAERLASDPSKGTEGAVVTITEYADFGCPSCRAWHQAGIIDQILDFYDGQVNFVWRDFPVITGRSPKAAEAGQCAYDQGEFWAYHDAVYEQPDSVVDLRVDALKGYAAEIGLDTELFNACLDSGQHKGTVQADWDVGRTLGLRGTPSFLVNGTYVIGGQPELIVQAIDQALAAQ
jgi:protein-disulfide isomerase